MDKAGWRKELLARRDAFRIADRRRAGKEIAHALLSLSETLPVRCVALYASSRSEVPTTRLALLLHLAGKVIALPAVEPCRKQLIFRRIAHRHQLCPGHYGIREPGPGCPIVAPKDLDLVILPGVGFDRLGYRLGYGAGYYDRFLPLLSPSAVTVGLAFGCQVVSVLPHDPLDQPVDLIVNENEIITAAQRRLGGQ